MHDCILHYDYHALELTPSTTLMRTVALCAVHAGVSHLIILYTIRIYNSRTLALELTPPRFYALLCTPLRAYALLCALLRFNAHLCAPLHISALFCASMHISEGICSPHTLAHVRTRFCAHLCALCAARYEPNSYDTVRTLLPLYLTQPGHYTYIPCMYL